MKKHNKQTTNKPDLQTSLVIVVQTIGMFEAKTHLPEVIRKVQKGEKYILTNRQQEVAVIMSMDDYYKGLESPIDRLKAVFKNNSLGNSEDILNMRDEGRK